jgi:hypothetical protein
MTTPISDKFFAKQDWYWANYVRIGWLLDYPSVLSLWLKWLKMNWDSNLNILFCGNLFSGSLKFILSIHKKTLHIAATPTPIYP